MNKNVFKSSSFGKEKRIEYDWKGNRQHNLLNTTTYFVVLQN